MSEGGDRAGRIDFDQLEDIAEIVAAVGCQEAEFLRAVPLRAAAVLRRRVELDSGTQHAVIDGIDVIDLQAKMRIPKEIDGSVRILLRRARRDVLEYFDIRVAETRAKVAAAAVG